LAASIVGCLKNLGFHVGNVWQNRSKGDEKVIPFGRFHSDDIEVGQRAIAKAPSDAFGDLTSKPQGGVIGFALKACVLVFSMFQTRVDPVTFTQLGD
jgi:hypothetical protein